MLVVSDTSPLLNLAIIGRLDVLRQQFQIVWAPPAVIAELRSEQDLPGSAVIREAQQAGWLRTERVRDRVRVALLLRAHLEEGRWKKEKGKRKITGLKIEDYERRDAGDGD